MNSSIGDHQLRIGEIFIGDIDAKNEILKQSDIDARVFMNGFSIPDHYRADEFDAGRIAFLLGFKGTGKTSLLRWMADERGKHGHSCHFLLFKSEVLEEDIGDANHSETRSRWAFRGDTTLALDRRMAFHRSLWQHLTLVDGVGEAGREGAPLRPRRRTPLSKKIRSAKRK